MSSRVTLNRFPTIANRLPARVQKGAEEAAEFGADIYRKRVRVGPDRPNHTHLRDTVYSDPFGFGATAPYALYEARGTRHMKGSGSFDAAVLETRAKFPQFFEDVFEG